MMKLLRVGVTAIAMTALAASVAPAFAQAPGTPPAAPAPVKAKPLDTGAKPATVKGSGGKKASKMKKTSKKHHHS